MKFPLLRTRLNLGSVAQDERHPIRQDLFNVYGRRPGILSNVVGIDPHDAANVREP